MIRRLLLTTIAALLCTTPALAGAKLVVGYGDQKADMFTDPRFLALGITHVRITVPWDSGAVSSELKRAKSWLAVAHAEDMQPLVSFDQSQLRGHNKVLPTAAQFRHSFTIFHHEYPWITDFATWNEANWGGEATHNAPGAVAGYYRVMRSVCPGCHVLAAEILDSPGFLVWVREFLHDLGYQPSYWGLHNYIGANRISDTTTRQMLAAVKGNVWFTETGGVVRKNKSSNTFPMSAPHAATVTNYIFNHLAKLSPRIQRVYLYEWDAKTSKDSWDSAVIGVNRAPRPAYAVLAKELFSLGVKPDCALSALPPSCVTVSVPYSLAGA
jgi:hypothetical protein